MTAQEWRSIVVYFSSFVIGRILSSIKNKLLVSHLNTAVASKLNRILRVATNIPGRTSNIFCNCEQNLGILEQDFSEVCLFRFILICVRIFGPCTAVLPPCGQCSTQ